VGLKRKFCTEFELGCIFFFWDSMETTLLDWGHKGRKEGEVVDEAEGNFAKRNERGLR
jgi:hypothetical protein